MFGRRPSIFRLIARVEYDAWAAAEGMPIEEACEFFLGIALPLLESAGISTEDPEKEGIVAEYEACLERTAISQEQAAAQAAEFARL